MATEKKTRERQISQPVHQANFQLLTEGYHVLKDYYPVIEIYPLEEIEDTLPRQEALHRCAPANAILFAYYSTALSQFNPYLLIYANQAQIAAHADFFRRALRTLLLQKRIHEIETANSHRNVLELRQHIDNQIVLCQQYLTLCRDFAADTPKDAQKKKTAIDQVVTLVRLTAENSPVKYLGVSMAITFVKDCLCDLNKWRLYWIWAGSLVAEVLHRATPDNFYNATSAREAIVSPGEALGYVSWTLYYFRFALTLGAIVNDVIAWDHLSDDEKDYRRKNRGALLWAGIKKYKYSIFNDLFWGTVNLLSAVLLIGAGGLIYSANVLVVGLLLADMLSAWMQMDEAEDKYKGEKASLEQAISELEKNISSYEAKLNLPSGIGTTAEEDKIKLQLARAQQELNEKNKLLKTLKRDWEYKQKELKQIIVYSAFLTLGWVVGSVLFPTAWAAPTVMMALSLAGAGVCFVATVIYQAATLYQETSKLQEEIQDNFNERNEALNKFDVAPDEPQKKYYFLQYNTLYREKLYLDKMMAHQRLKFFRAALIDVIIPAVVFASLIFLPAGGVSLGVLAAVFVLMTLSKNILDYFEPKRGKFLGYVDPDKQENETLQSIEFEYGQFNFQEHQKLLKTDEAKLSATGIFRDKKKGGSSRGASPALPPPLPSLTPSGAGEVGSVGESDNGASLTSSNGLNSQQST